MPTYSNTVNLNRTPLFKPIGGGGYSVPSAPGLGPTDEAPVNVNRNIAIENQAKNDLNRATVADFGDWYDKLSPEQRSGFAPKGPVVSKFHGVTDHATDESNPDDQGDKEYQTRENARKHFLGELRSGPSAPGVAPGPVVPTGAPGIAPNAPSGPPAATIAPNMAAGPSPASAPAAPAPTGGIQTGGAPGLPPVPDYVHRRYQEGTGTVQTATEARMTGQPFERVQSSKEQQAALREANMQTAIGNQLKQQGINAQQQSAQATAANTQQYRQTQAGTAASAHDAAGDLARMKSEHDAELARIRLEFGNQQHAASESARQAAEQHRQELAALRAEIAAIRAGQAGQGAGGILGGGGAAAGTQPAAAAPQEGAEQTSASGKPIVFRGGQWVYK